MTDIHLATCSYSEFDPAMGVPVRTSIGHPRFWSTAKKGRLFVSRLTQPTGLLDVMDPDEFLPRYLTLLNGRGFQAVWDELEAIENEVGPHEGPLVLMCFENLTKAPCHRTTLARWLAEHVTLTRPIQELGRH